MKLLLSGVLAALTLTLPVGALAVQTDITGPAGSGAFGGNVEVLPNGNFVVTDPLYDEGGLTDIGAVRLYNGITLALISTLKGSTTNDQVGNGGITVLSNGNFVVLSKLWDAGPVTNAGAVTWGSATTGINGVVSAANSLVGSTPEDLASYNTKVTPLSNGNYVVASPSWDNGSATNAGAVTWGNGATGVSGLISVANSLVGSTSGDSVGSGGSYTPGVTILSNGNYVVASPSWDTDSATNAGAVTWGNGATGISGVVSAAISLVGTSANDGVGSGGGSDTSAIIVLSSAHYIVSTPFWDNGTVFPDAGAVTWCDGGVGRTGAVSPANSLVGSAANDRVGLGANYNHAGVVAMINGHYAVLSYSWNNDTGAVTWCNGTTGRTGAVSAANSLIGSRAGDQAGNRGVTALTNGNYVVSTQTLTGSSQVVTWCGGTTITTGHIYSGSSFFRSHDSSGTVTALTNGNYVVSDPDWDYDPDPVFHVGAVQNVGAVTWCDGGAGRTGTASAANSLIGSNQDDRVGNGGVTALTNGNYVVTSTGWNFFSSSATGAATFGNGVTGTAGVVSGGNSLVGINPYFGGVPPYIVVIPLTNGNYVINNPSWNGAGIASWGSGTVGLAGVASAANSLVGSGAGQIWVQPLSNGNYVATNPNTSFGSVTWCNGTTGRSGNASSGNSLVGSSPNDFVGGGGLYSAPSVYVMSDDNYVIVSRYWDNPNTGPLPPGGPPLQDAGAISFGLGGTGTVGPVSAANSVVGTVANGGSSMNFSYDSIRSRLIVGYPAGNRVSLFNPSTGPEISVESPPNFVLTDGTASFNFGSMIVGRPSLPVTFIVRNIGTADLTLGTIAKDGANSGDFAMYGPGTIITPGSSATFTVTFTPSGVGDRSAAIHIASNDADENPFDIALTGTGTDALQQPAPPAPPAVNPQTGLAEQTVTVINSGTAPTGGLQLRIDGVPDGVTVLNGTYVPGTPASFAAMSEGSKSSPSAAPVGSGYWLLDFNPVLVSGQQATLLVQYGFTGPPVSFTPTVTIEPPTATPGPADPAFSSAMQGLLRDAASGQTTLTVRAVPGRSYQVRFSTDLVIWTPATTITCRSSQIAWSDDGSATGGISAGTVRRFYVVTDVTPD